MTRTAPDTWLAHYQEAESKASALMRGARGGDSGGWEPGKESRRRGKRKWLLPANLEEGFYDTCWTVYCGDPFTVIHEDPLVNSRCWASTFGRPRLEELSGRFEVGAEQGPGRYLPFLPGKLGARRPVS